MDKFRAMEAFARVAEFGSFTKAADVLGQPKGRVTTLVQQLEESLRTRLLQRTTRRVSLTVDGHAYLQGALRLLTDVQELEGALTASVSRPSGRLRVDVPASAGRHVLALALPKFFAQYPEIQIDLGSTDRPVDLVLEGIDCVIRGGALHDETLVARKLGAFPMCTCAAPIYLNAQGRPHTLIALREGGHQAVNFLSAKTGKIFDFEFTDARGTQHTFALPHTFAANDADTHVAAVVAGLGVAQLPLTPHVHELFLAKRLERILPDYDAGSLPLYILYPRNRHLSARTRVFVDWVVSSYQEIFEHLRSEIAPPVLPKPKSKTKQRSP